MSNEAFARVKIDALLAAQGWTTHDAKRFSVSPGDAAAQARAYAEQLGVPYVFLSNGDESEGVASRAAWRAG